MLREPLERYPVIVEVTIQHVVWLEAATPAEALARAQRKPSYELVADNETSTSYWDRARAPVDRWDWDTVYSDGSDGSYLGREANAHVEWHKYHLAELERAAKRAACIESGHPDTEKPLTDGRRWCKGCFAYLPAPAEVPSA